MRALIVAHKGIGLELQLSGNKKLVMPKGGSTEDNLTGDQVGHVRAHLESQERSVPMGPSQFGGHVKVLDPEYHKPPPPGSKAWLEGVAFEQASADAREALLQRLRNVEVDGKSVRIPVPTKATDAEAKRFEAQILATSVRLGLASEEEAIEAGARGLVSRSVARAAGAPDDALPPPEPKKKAPRSLGGDA